MCDSKQIRKIERWPLVQLSLAVMVLFSSVAKANICGTDYQNFNPTTSGLDFVTVHSSETLQPCVINLGLFFNHAVNSLTYSKTLSSAVQQGQKPKDRITAADLSIGYGINSHWDVGLSLPMVLSQQLDNEDFVSAFDRKGLTEVKLNTKYRFYGDATGGLAGVFSINNNLIQNNPFAGSGAGPTLNFELAVDKTFGTWAVGGNVGFRKRNPGSEIPGVPFVPLKDQFMYSVAGSYLFKDWDTKLILELYGSQAVSKTDQDTDKSLNATEFLTGIKYDINQKMAFHFGGAFKVLNSIGAPDYRIYTGINYAFGPLCDLPVSVRVKPAEVEIPEDPAGEVDENNYPLERFDGKLPTVVRFDSEVLFEFNSDRINKIVVPELQELIRELKDGGFKKLVVDGHTDSIGKRIYNQDLSDRRARNVRKHLVEKYFVLPERVVAQGFGEDRPIADNGNYQGRKQNRRVEFKIWK
jgi:outer membrane protein OmpA-like peptidoglycan-associated protein